jgi:hypothetical protein
MWWSIIADKLFGSVTDYFKVKQQHTQVLEQKKMELEVAKVTSEISMVEKQQDSDNSIDRITIADRGWKDDIITYVLISPFMVLLLNPLTALMFNYDSLLVSSAMLQGFEALEKIPSPMWYGLLIVFSDVYGLRSFMRSVFTAIAERMMNKIPK